jgi:hypothetical protein
VATHFGGNSNTNGSNLDKNNIIKSTFDTLMKKGHKAFETYHTDPEELLLLRDEMTRQWPILKGTTPIIIRKAEVTPIAFFQRCSIYDQFCVGEASKEDRLIIV